jgi:hypothetical protein
MNTDTILLTQNKKSQVRLEWIFGIRNDIRPNMYLLDNETLVYPAGHNLVIFNYTKKLPYKQIQQYIQGTPHSHGINIFNQ